jgi:hypothetical protein
MWQRRFDRVLAFGQVSICGIEGGIADLKNCFTRLWFWIRNFRHAQSFDPAQIIQEPGSHGKTLPAPFACSNALLPFLPFPESLGQEQGEGICLAFSWGRLSQPAG